MLPFEDFTIDNRTTSLFKFKGDMPNTSKKVKEDKGSVGGGAFETLPKLLFEQTGNPIVRRFVKLFVGSTVDGNGVVALVESSFIDFAMPFACSWLQGGRDLWLQTWA